MIAAALCISVGAQLVSLPTNEFTLRWQHTVEKTLWEEDYVVAADWLLLTRARIRGSGAGMEPPADAVKDGDAWSYRPADRWRRTVELAHSEFGDDYELCIRQSCRRISDIIGGRGVTTLKPCAAASTP
ncbi:MAG: hypothetical protein H6R02_1030 [Burkholderiaceae bacterium]|nr:hypothetical protein [Burkholderiaceae bacterium]